jgi:hypothetical protein
MQSTSAASRIYSDAMIPGILNRALILILGALPATVSFAFALAALLA